MLNRRSRQSPLTGIRGVLERSLLTILIWLTAGGNVALANPQVPMVVDGSVTFQTSPNRLDVNQTSDRAIVNWQRFSIEADEVTRINQPRASSVSLNRVTGGEPSEILGRLSSNGQVMLLNPNGILFGTGSIVDMAGLVASTSDVSDTDFMDPAPAIPGFHFVRSSKPGIGDMTNQIVNKGLISIEDGGLAALVAPWVENQGVIAAQTGRIQLGSAEVFTVDLFGDGLLEVEVSNLAASRIGIKNGCAIAGCAAQLFADGGVIQLDASAASSVISDVINVDGIVAARALENQAGRIVLTGNDAGTTRISGQLMASGIGSEPTTEDPLPVDQGVGGSIRVSGSRVVLEATSLLNVQDEGAGGSVELGYGADGASLPQSREVTILRGAAIFADGTSGVGGEVRIGAIDQVDHGGTVTIGGGVSGGQASLRANSIFYTGQTTRVEGSATAGRLRIDSLARSSSTDEEAGRVSIIDTVELGSTDAPANDRSIIDVKALSADLKVGTSAEVDSAGSLAVAVFENSFRGAGIDGRPGATSGASRPSGSLSLSSEDDLFGRGILIDDSRLSLLSRRGFVGFYDIQTGRGSVSAKGINVGFNELFTTSSVTINAENVAGVIESNVGGLSVAASGFGVSLIDVVTGGLSIDTTDVANNLLSNVRSTDSILLRGATTQILGDVVSSGDIEIFGSAIIKPEGGDEIERISIRPGTACPVCLDFDDQLFDPIDKFDLVSNRVTLSSGAGRNITFHGTVEADPRSSGPRSLADNATNFVPNEDHNATIDVPDGFGGFQTVAVRSGTFQFAALALDTNGGAIRFDRGVMPSPADVDRLVSTVNSELFFEFFPETPPVFSIAQSGVTDLTKPLQIDGREIDVRSAIDNDLVSTLRLNVDGAASVSSGDLIFVNSFEQGGIPANLSDARILVSSRAGVFVQTLQGNSLSSPPITPSPTTLVGIGAPSAGPGPNFPPTSSQPPGIGSPGFGGSGPNRPGDLPSVGSESSDQNVNVAFPQSRPVRRQQLEKDKEDDESSFAQRCNSNAGPAVFQTTPSSAAFRVSSQGNAYSVNVFCGNYSLVDAEPDRGFATLSYLRRDFWSDLQQSGGVRDEILLPAVAAERDH